MVAAYSKAPAAQPSVTPAIAAVDALLVQAKHRITLAALGCMRQATDAAELVQAALREVEAARGALAQMQERDDAK